MIGEPPVAISAMPEKMVRVASVMMKGGTRNQAMNAPLKAPPAAPARIPTRMPARSESVRPIASMAKQLDMATSEPTDRSMPAVMIT